MNLNSDLEEFFKIYIEVAKHQLKQLPNTSDRIIGTKWILLFISMTNPDELKLRNHFLKLFLVSLEGQCLVGPFQNPPDPVEPFKVELQPADIRKLVLNSKSKNYPYFVEFTKNLCEYSVYQVHNFGAQIYYAFSPEPIPTWEHSENAILKTRDEKGPRVYLPDISIFGLNESQEDVLENNERIDQILTSTRIIPEPSAKTTTFQVSPGKKFDPKSENDLGDPIKKPKSKPKLFKRSQQPAFDFDEQLEISNSPEKKDEKKVELLQSEVAKAKIPERLLKRLQQNYVPVSKEERLLQTPTVFKTGPKKKGPHIKYRPEEFGIGKDEKFQPAKPFFRNLEWTPSKRDGRTQIRDIANLPQKPIMESTRIEENIDDMQEPDFEDFFDRSYKSMMEKLYQPKADKPHILSPRSQALYDKIHAVRKVEPKKLIFAEQEPEEFQSTFKRMKYQELPDQDSPDDNILGSDEMDSGGLFDEDQIAEPVLKLGSTKKKEEVKDSLMNSIQQKIEALKLLQGAAQYDDFNADDVLGSDEMDTDNFFGEGQGVEEPHYKTQMVSTKDDTLMSKSIQKRYEALKAQGMGMVQAVDQAVNESVQQADHSYLSDDEMSLGDLFPIVPKRTEAGRQFSEYYKEARQPRVSSSEDEHLKSYEIDELFGYDDEAEEPLPLRDIPMQSKSPIVHKQRKVDHLLQRPALHRSPIKPVLNSIDLADESLPAELGITQDSIKSILDDHEMDIGDMFDGENIVSSPTNMIPRDKMAVMTSVAQSRRFKDIQRKMRRKRGEEEVDEPEVENQALQRIMEEHLMYPTEFKNFSAEKNILDRSIDKTKLPPPLIGSPKKRINQQLAEYEKDIDEHYKYGPQKSESREHFHSYEIDEFVGYEDEYDDPLPPRDIQIPKITPQEKIINYHLERLPLPTRRERIIDLLDDIGDESMPDLHESKEIPIAERSAEPTPSTTNDLLQSIAQSRTLRDLQNKIRERRGETPLQEEQTPVVQETENRLAVEDLIEQIENLAPTQQIALLTEFEKDLDDYYEGEGEDFLEDYEIDELLGYEDEYDKPVNVRDLPIPERITPTRRTDFLSSSLPKRIERRIYVGNESPIEDESFDLEDTFNSVISQKSYLDENEMNISGMFAEDQLMDPKHFISPKKMALKMSVAQSNRIRNLRNRFREQRGEEALVVPEFQENIPEFDEQAEFRRMIKANNILNSRSPGPNPIKDFDEYPEPEQRDEHMQSFEVDELFGYDEEGTEPLPVHEYPMPSPMLKTPPRVRTVQKPPRYFDHPSDEDFLNPEEMEYLFGDQDDEFASPISVKNLPASSRRPPTQKKREYVNVLGQPRITPLPNVDDYEDLEQEESPSFLDLFFDKNTSPVKYCRADKSAGLEDLQKFSSSKDGPQFVDLFVNKSKTPVKYVKDPRPEIIEIMNRLEKIKMKTPMKETRSSPIRPVRTPTPKRTPTPIQFPDKMIQAMQNLDLMSPPKNFGRSFEETSPPKGTARHEARRELFSEKPHTPSKPDRLMEKFNEIAYSSSAHLDAQEFNINSDDLVVPHINSVQGLTKTPRVRPKPLYVPSDEEDYQEADDESNEFEYSQSEMDFRWLENFRPTTPSPNKRKGTGKIEPRVAALSNRKALDTGKIEDKRVPAKNTTSKKQIVPVKRAVPKSQVSKKPLRPKTVPKTRK